MVNTSGLKRGGSPGRPKGKKDSKPRVLESVREEAARRFHEEFRKRMDDMILTAFRQATGKDADARMVQYAWDRVLGKPSQQVDLGAGQGVAGVEVTYRIVGTPKPDA